MLPYHPPRQGTVQRHRGRRGEPRRSAGRPPDGAGGDQRQPDPPWVHILPERGCFRVDGHGTPPHLLVSSLLRQRGESFGIPVCI